MELSDVVVGVTDIEVEVVGGISPIAKEVLYVVWDTLDVVGGISPIANEVLYVV